MGVVVIEARDIGKVFPARVFKGFLDLFVDLFQRFDTVGGKGGRNHGDAFFAILGGQARDLFDRIGFEPFFGAEFRLEGGDNLRVVPAKAFFQQACVFLALAMIRIALHQIPLGHAVIGHDQHFGFFVRLGIGLFHGLR